LNTVTDEYGTVGGGYDNQAGDDAGTTTDAIYATVGGGQENTASGDRSTVGGGTANTASGSRATVSGGTANASDGIHSAIGGGWANTANGFCAASPGGRDNAASGDYSLAAGRSASATHDNSFVWGDTVGGGSANTDTFNIHASNGVYLNGALHAASDRNKKENFEPVDSRDVLEKVAELPMSTWSYKREDGGYRHMGPMGQDFRTAFGLGSDEKHITTVDADGVALAAIQGLYEVVEEKDAQIAALKAEKDAEIRMLKARLAAVEEAISKK
jgi:hypothetical protein